MNDELAQRVERELAAARRLAPDAPPPRRSGLRLLVVWLSLIAIFVVAFHLFNR